MCGIAGFFGKKKIDDQKVQDCLKQMHRRGPDDAASYHHQAASGIHAHLLFARLSIIDLRARANQPLKFGSKVITFNGELYNFRELKADLESKGEVFQTTSDTEVLLRVLSREGLKGLDRCEGMWAFALYDEKDGTLTLCRDRFGEKPLYYHADAEGVAYGSEPKFVFSLLGRRLKVNVNHLKRFVVNGYKSLYKGKEGFFEGLHEVEAGTALVIQPSLQKEKIRYWNPKYEQDSGMSYADAVKGARERLIQSVGLRLRADVPLAFCMSGGVDSNSLISIAKRVFNYDVHGFTIVNTGERYEEQDLIRLSVKELGIRHTEVLPSLTKKNFISGLKELVRQHDAPIYTITYYVHWLLMKSIHEHGYKVSVSGTAADEIFTGYFDHHLFYLSQVSGDKALYEKSRLNWEANIKPVVRNPFLQSPDAFVKNPKFRDHIFLGAEGFSDYLQSPWSEQFAEERFTSDELRNRMLNEIFHEATPVILHEDDLNAMYYSIENRSPFLDRELFEFCSRIPTRHLIQNGMAKAVLRDAMEGIVPDAVIRNPRKVGFNAPIFDLLDVEDPEVRQYLLGDSPIFEIFRRDKFEGLLNKKNLANSESKFLFYFLNTKIFLEEFA